MLCLRSKSGQPDTHGVFEVAWFALRPTSFFSSLSMVYVMNILHKIMPAHFILSKTKSPIKKTMSEKSKDQFFQIQHAFLTE
jgi:hypothetical protein